MYQIHGVLEISFSHFRSSSLREFYQGNTDRGTRNLYGTFEMP
jgi:hypothetical protein